MQEEQHINMPTNSAQKKAKTAALFVRDDRLSFLRLVTLIM